MTMNGALAGLVGVTAGCDIVSNYGALAIGVICGFAVVLVVEFVDRVLKIDDPVGAHRCSLGLRYARNCFNRRFCKGLCS